MHLCSVCVCVLVLVLGLVVSVVVDEVQWGGAVGAVRCVERPATRGLGWRRSTNTRDCKVTMSTLLFLLLFSLCCCLLPCHAPLPYRSASGRRSTTSAMLRSASMATHRCGQQQQQHTHPPGGSRAGSRQASRQTGRQAGSWADRLPHERSRSCSSRHVVPCSAVVWKTGTGQRLQHRQPMLWQPGQQAAQLHECSSSSGSGKQAGCCL